MSHSKFEYIRNYEEATEQILLPNSFIVIRVDGKNFHRLSRDHNFLKPNDKRSLDLMSASAKSVIRSYYPNIVLAYGQSDEYSFLFRRKTSMFNRRKDKIVSLVVSLFSSAFVFHWSDYFTHPLNYPPSFDGRCILFPRNNDMMDYFKWRQVDCHVNNLYNTTFHALTGLYTKYDKEGQVISILNEMDVQVDNVSTTKAFFTAREAQKRLEGTVSGQKHDILFLEYGINYNNELEIFKKGTILLPDTMSDKEIIECKNKGKMEEININIKNLHTSLINETFWKEYEYLLA